MFILSAPHSGSTWLGYVLGSHKASAFLGEYERGWQPHMSVPCTLCAANGLPHCAVLGRLDDVPVAEAFAWAFGRLPSATVLVDNSKRRAWAAKFLGGANDIDVALIHLIKDPRSWLASVQRRHPGTVGDQIGDWYTKNAAIRDFVAAANCPAVRVVYDELAQDQEAGFRRLFRFLGLRFDPAALQYWKRTHHGFAANGASLPILAHADGPPPAHFRTGDDDFYAAHTATQFVDRRWQQQLSAADLAVVAGDERVAAMMAHFDRRLTPDGLAKRRSRLYPPAWLRQVWAAD